ncbi:MAG: VOC family protein [Burkholderiales bacterium]
MVDLHDIRYVRLGTPDLDRAIDFATKIVGLELVRREAGCAYFRSDRAPARGDARDHTLVYFEGDPNHDVAGFELSDPADFDTAAAAFEKAGHRIRIGTKSESEQRRVRQFMTLEDPSGNRIEVVARPYHSGVRSHPARDAGITGFGHLGLRTTHAARDEAFWTRLCSARVSDWIGEGARLRIGTAHHSLALVPSHRPGIHHINHQVEDLDDIMRSWYFLREQGVKILFGPGRDPSSGACFLSFEGLDRMIYQYSAGAKRIQPDEEARYRARQFPFEAQSFCMWGALPAIAEFDTRTGHQGRQLRAVRAR